MLAWVSPALFRMKQRRAKPGEQAQEEAQRTYQFQKWTVKPGRRAACGDHHAARCGRDGWYTRQPTFDFYFGKTIICAPILPEITMIGSLEYTAIVTILPGESISGSSS